MVALIDRGCPVIFGMFEFAVRSLAVAPEPAFVLALSVFLLIFLFVLVCIFA